MDILAVTIALSVLLLASTWSFARSYFLKGRLAGMEEAALEIIRGIRSHYEGAGQAPPAPVATAIEALGSPARHALDRKGVQRYQARLWVFGDAVGAACWRKGYAACRLRLSPPQDKIRIDLSVADLLHLSSLAHLGFKKMMPNDRDIELHRFGGEDHAIEVAYAVERLEHAIPDNIRSFDHAASRDALIRNWWPPQRKSA